MKDYINYLFDADGTLLDTREAIYQSFVYATTSNGLEVPGREYIDSTIGMTLKAQMELLTKNANRPELLEKMMTSYRDHHAETALGLLDIFPGVAEGLEKLHNLGKKLSVVSSRSQPFLNLFLEHVGILKYFPVVVSAKDTNKHKPEPEPALKALELMDGKAADSVFIGDAEFDMSCGKAAGMDVVLVSWGGMNPSSWPVKPDMIVNSFAELLPN